jgi:hypothetical protein
MAASHALAMECLLRTRHSGSLQRFEANGKMGTKFLRTFAVQMETLAGVRPGGKQKVIVEHVHIHAGDRGSVRSENPERQPMLDVAGDGKEPLPHARRRTRKRRA